MNVSRVARIAVAMLGAWLLVSAFLWPDTREQTVNTALVGMCSLALALAALFAMPRLNYLNVGLAIWLFLSLWILPGISAATVANNMTVATLMFGFAVVPVGPGPRDHPTVRHPFPA